jgi:hypothetical protein
MAGLDSPPSAGDGGSPLASAGTASAGGLAGPIAALLASLGGTHGKSTHSGTQFSLPGDPTDSVSADPDGTDSMPELFGSFSGNASGKRPGQSPSGLPAGSSLGLPWSGTTLPATLVRSVAAKSVLSVAADQSTELAAAPTGTADRGANSGKTGGAAGLPELPPGALQPSPSGPVGLSVAESPPLIVPASAGDPAPPVPVAAILTAAADLNQAGAAAGASGGSPNLTSLVKSPARSEARWNGIRGGEGEKTTAPDQRTAADSASSDGASAGIPVPAAEAKASSQAEISALPSASAGGGEKFAGFSAGAGNGGGSAESGSNKNSLEYDNKDDTKQSSVVGTTSAQSVSVMPSARSNRTLAPNGEPRAFLSPASATATLPSATAAVTASPATTAHRAIESIARIAEAQANRAGSADSVSFGFKVGEQNLTVRVEMRGGEVRTQFSTDSSDLRSALANEWSTLANGAENRSYQFSAPVFTTADGRPAGSGGDTGGSSREAPSPSPAVAGRFASSGDEPAEVSTGATPTTAPVTAQRLHTFA